MRPTVFSLDSWPRGKKFEYLFHSTKQATFFAHLCFDKPEVVESIKMARTLALSKISRERTSKSPNFQYIFDLSVNAQLFRECLEEVDRLHKEVH